MNVLKENLVWLLIIVKFKIVVKFIKNYKLKTTKPSLKITIPKFYKFYNYKCYNYKFYNYCKLHNNLYSNEYAILSMTTKSR